jgi:hypothetical protein
MTTKQRIFYGGLGAVTPLATNLLIIDASVILSQFNWLTFFGYCIRSLVLLGIGGLIAHFNDDLEKPQQVFTLGLSAPALILSMMTASNSAQGMPTSPGLFIPAVHASSDPPDIHRFTWPQETVRERWERGAYGRITDRTQFVIIYVTEDIRNARMFRDATRQRQHFSSVEVYVYERTRRVFMVVVGAHLRPADAQQLLKHAIGKAYKLAFVFDLRQR